MWFFFVSAIILKNPTRFSGRGKYYNVLNGRRHLKDPRRAIKIACNLPREKHCFPRDNRMSDHSLSDPRRPIVYSKPDQPIFAPLGKPYYYLLGNASTLPNPAVTRFSYLVAQ